MSSILALVIMLAIVFGLAGKLIYDGIKTGEKKKIINAVAVILVFVILIVIMATAGR